MKAGNWYRFHEENSRFMDTKIPFMSFSFSIIEWPGYGILPGSISYLDPDRVQGPDR